MAPPLTHPTRHLVPRDEVRVTTMCAGAVLPSYRYLGLETLFLMLSFARLQTCLVQESQ